MTALSSKRLQLVPFSIDDADELFLVRGDALAMEFWDWPADATREDTRAVARAMIADIESGAARVWTVRRRDDGAFVGVVDLSLVARNEVDLGFMICRNLWDRGYAFETASMVIALGWAEGLARIGARIHAENLRSRWLLTKLGFSVVAESEVEVRPGAKKLCTFFSLGNPAQGSSSLSQYRKSAHDSCR